MVKVELNFSSQHWCVNVVHFRAGVGARWAGWASAHPHFPCLLLKGYICPPTLYYQQSNLCPCPSTLKKISTPLYIYYLLTLCEYKEAKFLATIHMFAKEFFYFIYNTACLNPLFLCGSRLN